MESPVIEVRDLWFSFNGQPVLKEVNLTIHSGCFLAVIGPNGGGKTTLLKLMLGLLEPDRGTVSVLGSAPKEVTPRIGYVPQDIGVNGNFPISVLNVALMGRMRGGGGWWRFSKEDRMVAQKALERMEMWGYSNHRMEELSGGQRQRVFIARALVAEPEILLLDEPTASVDTKGQSDLYEFLKELNETVTIVVVSHDLSIVSSYVKSVACVNQNLIFHDAAEITGEMLEMAYHCPVELIAHGLPHRVLREHKD
ncbi:MAG: metal ABC transporter ATP-binding protein [Deltaproteobacteria bacterium]|nr:metal ABC transporter ATP-binding protein [Deltaproteobacteria bacterium]MBW2117358.1 metal ABC transporter ATP-binding protein [Deltaproteobacteria bacterium]